MKVSDYTIRKDDLKKRFNKDLESIHIEFAKSNNPYKIGDILQDHYQIIKVTEIGFQVTGGVCVCVYRGYRLKKNLKSYLSEKFSSMWQLNVSEKLN